MDQDSAATRCRDLESLVCDFCFCLGATPAGFIFCFCFGRDFGVVFSWVSNTTCRFVIFVFGF